MPYIGNKRSEVETIYSEISMNDITTIIEPFCGSCAMSYYIWTLHPDLKFILNDNDKNLKEMYDIIIDDDKLLHFQKTINEILLTIRTKETYMNYLKTNNDIYSWFIRNKYKGPFPGTFRISNKTGSHTPLNIKSYPIYNFFRTANIEYTCSDAIDIFKQYSNNKHNLILLDPPYIMSYNLSYSSSSNVNIYEYLSTNNINKLKSNIMLILEDIWVIRLLFSGFKFISYDKVYKQTKKQTTHIIIKNKQLI
jgi:site-specific DNA-adenine methylase